MKLSEEQYMGEIVMEWNNIRSKKNDEKFL